MVCALGPNLDNYSYASLLLLQSQLPVEGTHTCYCALQYLFNLNLILSSSLWQVADIFGTFRVEVLDDLHRQSYVSCASTDHRTVDPRRRVHH